MGTSFVNVFNRLSHFAPLLSTSTAIETLDTLIEHSILLEPSKQISDCSALREILAGQFQLDFSNAELGKSLKRLRDRGRLFPSGPIRVALAEQARLVQLIEEKERLEADVKEEWGKDVIANDPNLQQGDVERIWEAQKDFLARLFKRHGAQCASLIGTVRVQPDDFFQSMPVTLSEATRSLPSSLALAASKVIPYFFQTASPRRIQYLAELLDNTFAFFSLTLDNPMALYVQRQAVNVVLFLDTNVVLGLFDLSENSLAPASKELINTIQSHKLNVMLYLSPATIKELNLLFQAVQGRLGGRKWTRELSQAAVECGTLTPVDLAFHRANSVTEIEPDAFVEKLKHIQALTKGTGIKPYVRDLSSIEKSEALASSYAHYDQFLLQINRPKNNDAIWHDMVNRELIRQLRSENLNPSQTVRHFFLTCDYTLIAFDQERRREQRDHETAFCMLPPHFLQLLRPVLPRTADFDKAFVSTFAIPQFRTVEFPREILCAKILRTMATYADVSKEIASTILSDTIFTNRLAAVEERGEEFSQLIRERVLEEAVKANDRERVATAEGERLRGQLVTLKNESQSNAEAKLLAADTITRLQNQVGEVQQYLTTITQERDLLFAKVEVLVKSGEANLAELGAIKEKLERREARWQLILRWGIRIGLALIPIIMTLAFYWNTYWLRWPWLQNHLNREKLLVGAYLLLLTVYSIVAVRWVRGKTRKDWIFYCLGLGSSIVIAIIDWA